jgi:hypothetical protein
VSNTAWGRFENGEGLKPRVQQAVAAAFGWPSSWPEESDQADPDELSRLREIVQAQGEELRQVAKLVSILTGDVEALKNARGSGALAQ